MTRLCFGVLAWISLVTTGGAAAPGLTPPARPNVVVVLMDDLGWKDLGCCGGRFIETPRADELARGGMRFARAYASAPVCSPTRASLLTGQSPARHGMYEVLGLKPRPFAEMTPPPNRTALPASAPRIARALVGEGYISGSFGKWHVGGTPQGAGFAPATDHANDPALAEWAEARPHKRIGPITVEAVRFLRRHRHRPFALWINHYAAHAPFEACERLVEKYREKARRTGVRDIDPVYAAMVEEADEALGRVLDELETLGLSGRTAVIFTSDNGGLIRDTHLDPPAPLATSNVPLRGQKGELYEGGIRVPLIVRWPGVTRAGSVCDEPVISADLYPTILEICGAGAPVGEPCDGVSLAPALRGVGGLGREALHWHFPTSMWDRRPCGAILKGDHKLVERFDVGRVELFDLRADPGESRDLAAERPDLARALARDLRAWRERLGAAMPARNPGHDPARAGEFPPRSAGVLSLDGVWRIAFDRRDEGLGAGWHRPSILEKRATREIRVPSCWEEIEEDYEGVAWYAREVEVPADWRGRHVRLRFDAVNYRAEVWIDGQMVGGGESGFTPIEFDVTPHLRYGGKSRMAVRVVGPAVRVGRVDNYVRNETPHWRGAYLGGIWQSARLIATDPVFVRDVFVLPDIARGGATVRAEIANETCQPIPTPAQASTPGKRRGPVESPSGIAARHVDAEIRIARADSPGEAVATHRERLAVEPGGMRWEARVTIPDARLWSPESPALYVATVRLGEGDRSLDEAATRFGLREFAARDGDFYLNGRRIILKGAFWEGLYPVTLGHPREGGIVRREIAMAKEAGFNLLRPWRMAPAPMILDLADEMGILLIGSPAIACMGYWPEETPRMEEHWTRAFVEMIRRDRNHPSIAMWETTNEIVRKSMLTRRHRVTLAGRAADPTRAIIDESGGARSPWGSFVYPPRATVPTRIDDRHIYRRAPVDDEIYEDLRTYGAEGQAVFVSEFGYGSFPDLVENMARFRRDGNPITPPYRYHAELLAGLEHIFRERALGDIFPDIAALCRASQEIQAHGNRLQLEALRVNPKVDGYCLHAYTDGDWVVGAGVLDMWRQPKALYGVLKEAQRPLHLAVRVSPGSVLAGRRARLSVTAVNDGPPVAGALELSVAGAGDARVWDHSVPARIEAGIRRWYEGEIETRALRGVCAAVATLRGEGGAELAKGAAEFLVWAEEDVRADLSGIALVDPAGRFDPYLARRGVRPGAFDAGATRGPVVVTSGEIYSEREAVAMIGLIDWIRRGGVALWLDPPSCHESIRQPIYNDPEKNFMMRFSGRPRRPGEERPNYAIAAGIFPLTLKHRLAQGGWIPANHYARRHPILDGIEVSGFLDWRWQNVIAKRSLVDPEIPAVAGCVSWQSHHDYRAETRAWHGVDLGVARWGKGKMILSTLDLVSHLGDDPLAEKLLRNLLAFARAEVVPLEGGPGPGEREIAQKLAAFRRIKEGWEAKEREAAALGW